MKGNNAIQSSKAHKSRARQKSLQLPSQQTTSFHHHHTQQASYLTHTLPTTHSLINHKKIIKKHVYNRNSIFNSIISHIKQTSHELTLNISQAKKSYNSHMNQTARSSTKPVKVKKLIFNKDLGKRFNSDSTAIDTSLLPTNTTHREHNDSKTTLMTIVPQKPVRIKTFLVNYITKWDHHDTASSANGGNVIRLMELQKMNIRDQIAILLDNVQNYKLTFFSDQKIMKMFRFLSEKNQKEINATIEETIGFIVEIAYIIIMDLGKYVDKFIVNPLHRFTKEDNKNVYEEEDELYINAKLFNDSSLFLKACDEVYDTVSKEEEDFVLSKKSFEKVIQYLERGRMSVSKLLITTKNLYHNYQHDLELAYRYSMEMKKIDEEAKKKQEQVNDIKKREPLSYHKHKYIGGLDATNYKGPIQIQISEENEKIRRLDRVLGKNNDEQLQLKKDIVKKKLKKTFNINSRLIDDLLKYSTDEFRRKVHCERIMMRFREKNEEKDQFELY